MESEIYKKNQAQFVGEDAELRSTGSVYKRNLANFHGVEAEPAKFKVT